MNDWRSDPELESRLRDRFRTGDLPAAPGRLMDALERVPDAPIALRAVGGRRGPRTGRGTTFGILGVAAVLLVGGALALSGGSQLTVPSSSVDVPGSQAVADSPAVAGPRITYRAAWTSGVPATAAGLANEVDAVRRRIEAIGADGATVRSTGADTVNVDFPVGFDVGPIRSRGLIIEQGLFAFSPLDKTQISEGDLIDAAKFPPLFGADGIADVSVGSTSTGERVLHFTLTPDAATLFGAYTAAHIGTSFAISLDGVVVSAPTIRSAIPGGNIDISQAGGWDPVMANEIVAIAHTPLPVPLREISVERVLQPTPWPTPVGTPIDCLAPELFGPTFDLPETFPIDLVCEPVPYRSFTIHIDPTAPQPIWASTDTNAHVQLFWNEVGDRGAPGPPAEIVNSAAMIIVSDGAVITLTGHTSPTLPGYQICTSSTVIGVSRSATP